MKLDMGCVIPGCMSREYPQIKINPRTQGQTPVTTALQFMFIVFIFLDNSIVDEDSWYSRIQIMTFVVANKEIYLQCFDHPPLLCGSL